MARGSADVTSSSDIKDTLKLVPEGIEGSGALQGPSETSLHSSPGDCAAAIGVCRARGNLAEFQ